MKQSAMPCRNKHLYRNIQQVYTISRGRHFHTSVTIYSNTFY